MTNLLFKHDLISIKELDLASLELIFSTAEKIKLNPVHAILNDKIIAHCFFEASTRTRLSFETAALKLGAKNIGFANAESLSLKKGESLQDTIRMMDEYADLIIIRHPLEGAAAFAAIVAEHPVINAGDGANQHPSQAIIDLFSMRECQNKINGLAIALVGDLKYARTIHSLCQACSLFDIRLYLVAPELLALPNDICDMLKKRGVRFSYHHSLEEVISKIDILYMTRIQEERFNSDPSLMHETFILTPSMLTYAKPNLKILHPLPRIKELPVEIDESAHAYYFQQAKNGVVVRQALLSLILNESIL